MDIQTYITPVNIAFAAAGLVLSAALVFLLARSGKAIGRGLVTFASKIGTGFAFFYLVTVVVMAVSVLESGEFFDKNITYGAFGHTLGYALAASLDLVSVVCLMARLNAIRMHEDRGARWPMVGVILCAAISAFANVTMSLQNFNEANLAKAGPFQHLAPWVGILFPVLIIILSLVADQLVDSIGALKKLSIDDFKADLKKRVDLIKAKSEAEEDMAKAEIALSMARQARDRARGKQTGQPREWRLLQWLRPVVPMPLDDLRNEMQAFVDDAIKASQQVVDMEQIMRDATTRLDHHNEEHLRLVTDHLQTSLLLLVTDHLQRAGQSERQTDALDVLDAGQSAIQSVGPTTDPTMPTVRRATSKAPARRASSAVVGRNKKKSTKSARIDDAEAVVLAYLTDHPDATLTEIVQMTGVGRATASTYRRQFKRAATTVSDHHNGHHLISPELVEFTV